MRLTVDQKHPTPPPEAAPSVNRSLRRRRSAPAFGETGGLARLADAQFSIFEMSDRRERAGQGGPEGAVHENLWFS